MKKIKKSLFLSVIFTIIFLVAICRNVYATSTNSTNTSNSNTSTTNTTSTTGNANLSNLGIRPNDFSGFKADTTSYSVIVPTSTEAVEVYATAQNSKATVTGTGTKKLDIGNNKLVVTVTAEDGTEKTYTINVTRKGKNDSTEGNTENVSDRYSGEGLSKLTINDLQLDPEFDTNTYEYSVKYIGDAESLNIETEATDPYYTVEVTGNYNLLEGENIITILVSNPDGENVATYQLEVNKSLVDEEALQREQQEKADKQKKIIIGVIVAVVIIVIIIIIKVRRNRLYEDEYNFEDDYDEDDYYEEDEEDEEVYNNRTTKKKSDIEEKRPTKRRKDKIEEQPTKRRKKNTIEEQSTKENEEDIIEDKDELKKRFLENYGTNSYNDYEEINEKPTKKNRKGKRFK